MANFLTSNALLKLCLTSTYFTLEDQFYKQTFCPAFESRLSSVVANIFMEPFETQPFATFDLKLEAWLHYVDDIFIIW